MLRAPALTLTAAAMVLVLSVAGVWPAKSTRPRSRERSAAPAALRLQSLPLQAQSVISSTLGSDRAGFGAQHVRGGYRLAGGGVQVKLANNGVVFATHEGSLSMLLAGVGRGRHVRSLDSGSPSAKGNRVTYHGSGLEQWYAAGPLGIEQGFTLASRPGGHGGPLTLALGLGGSLRPERVGSKTIFRTPAGRSALGYGALSALDASGRRLPAALALSGHSLLLHVDDRGARYPLRIDPLVQQGGKLTAEGEEGQAKFGWSVALSADGNSALIGAPADNSGQGAAWVFTRAEAGTWSEQGGKLTGALESGKGQFGFSVALSADGNTALIGGPSDNGEAGAAWVFTRSGSTWAQQGEKLTGGAEQSGPAEFGTSVALAETGTTALIGGFHDNHQAGAAWVFTREGGKWGQQGEKLIGDCISGCGGPRGTGEVGQGEPGGSFGFSVALSYDGNTALIGAPGDNGVQGATWVFTRSGGKEWNQQGPKLTGGGEQGGAGFGDSVALSGNGQTAAIGGPFDGASKGAVWVFTQQAGNWRQEGEKLIAAGECLTDGFGESVALSSEGDTALIGGPRDNANTGAAWFFTRSGERWLQQGAKLTADNEIGQGYFGESVALSGQGNTALIGGYGDNANNGASWVFAGSPTPAPTGLCGAIAIAGTPTNTQTTSAPALTTTSATTAVTPMRPTLEHVSQSHSSWREGAGLARASELRPGTGRRGQRQAPIGTTFSLTLNEQASVSFAFTQQLAGHEVKGKCVANTRNNRRRHACTRTVRVGTLSFGGHDGKNSVSFQGRISPSKKLRPGRYTLVVTAANSAGQRSAPARLSFTIVK